MKEKIDSVDGVRGVACLMVLLSHLSLIFFPYVYTGRISEQHSQVEYYIYHSPFAFFYSGTAAVFIFFVLSGYILSFACCRNGDILNNCLKMTMSRYPRLMLPTLGSVLLCYFVMIATPDGFNTLSWIGGVLDVKGHDLPGAIYNGLVSAVLFCDRSYNIIIWTMQVEFFGSLIVFCMTPLIVKVKYKEVVLFTGALLMICISPDKIGASYACFLIGSAIYHAEIKPSKLTGYLALIAGLYFAGFHNKSNSYSIIYELMSFKAPGGKSNPYYLSNMISGVLIVFAVVKSGVAQCTVTNRVSLYLGKVSYSAYLIQIPVFYVMTQIGFDLFKSLGLSYEYSAIFTSLVTISSVYMISTLFYIYVDKKSIKISKLSHKLIAA